MHEAGESHCWVGATVHSPLKVEQWRLALQEHADRVYTNYICSGIEHGFRIGFNREKSCFSAARNLPISHPEVVASYIDHEVLLQRIVRLSCPKTAAHALGIQISPIRIIPKKNRPNKWRLITDLSSPHGLSVNDGIEEDWSSLEYVSIDHLAHIVTSVGRGAFLVKADIKEAYRMVPVHPEDHRLLGIFWDSQIFIDTRLPFGLRSAPKIFNAIADAAQWILLNRVSTLSR